MNNLELNKLEIITGGDFIGGLCTGLGAGSLVYAAALATNFWNPIGWVSAAFIVGDVACASYGVYQVYN